MPEYKVFISYSSTDAEWAIEFTKSLNKRGLEAWIDKFNVKAGESLREAMEEGLKSSDMLVIIVSSEGVMKPTLFFELGAALATGKKIISIVPKDFNLSILPRFLRLNRHLIKGSPDNTAKELVVETE